MIRYQWLIDLAFGFLPGILFRGQNLLLCKLLLVLDQISGGGGGGGQKSLREPNVGESDSMNNRISSEMKISHHYL